MTVEAIKEAIVHLSELERNRLAEWFDELKELEWDRQMEKDFAPGGRGVHLLVEVDAEISARRTRPLEEVLAEVKVNRERSKSRSLSLRRASSALSQSFILAVTTKRS